MTAADAWLHLSDDPGVDVFVPRPVLVPSVRQSGHDWLNGPLVWAVSRRRRATYLFPRDCPRIVLWATEATTDADRERWLGDHAGMVAYVEADWMDRLSTEQLACYELPPASFEPLEQDPWMAISRLPVRPVASTIVPDLLAALEDDGARLVVMNRLTPLAGVWDSSVHASGIRLRNALDWPD